jgi:GntR family transcriptional regulator
MATVDVQLERDSPIPLYHQLAGQLRSAIESGVLAKGAFLDNELELTDAWQVSRPTVRRAIQELVGAGLLTRRRGVGTQIVNDQVRRPLRLSSLFDDLNEAGRKPTTVVLEHRIVPADADVAGALEVPKGHAVVYLKRCRSTDVIKLAILRNWLTVEAAGGITTEEFNSHGLYQLIRARGVRPKFATQRIGAALATAADAAALGLPVGSALVTMRRVMKDEKGAVVELGDHLYDAAHYAVEMTVIDG